MRKICARWVPHSLTEDQRQRRVEISQQLLARYREEGDFFLRRIVTLDETWARCFEPELKRQSAEWHHRDSPPSSRPRKFRQGPSQVKVMLIVAYDMQGIILVHHVPPKTTVNSAYYRHFLQQNLRPALRKKRQNLLQDGVLILHDNATPHKAHTVQALLEEYQWETLPHAPYSPDLSPCDFHLFPSFKMQMRGKRFEDLNEVIAAADRYLREACASSPIGGIAQLPQRWQSAIDFEGHYFEGFS